MRRTTASDIGDQHLRKGSFFTCYWRQRCAASVCCQSPVRCYPVWHTSSTARVPFVPSSRQSASPSKALHFDRELDAPSLGSLSIIQSSSKTSSKQGLVIWVKCTVLAIPPKVEPLSEGCRARGSQQSPPVRGSCDVSTLSDGPDQYLEDPGFGTLFTVGVWDDSDSDVRFCF